jgi:UDP-GlcNAc:undecaprenyl-phosphate GlcNAc-1-phosphate transferase
VIELVADFLPVIAAAGLIAFVAAPFTLLIARRAGFVDQPSVRKPHLRPMPLLGGVAIYAGLLAGLIMFGNDEPVRELVAIAAGATLLGGLGLWDDRYGMNPRIKMAGQAVAGTLLVLGGVQVKLFNNNYLDMPLTVLWVVGICNAINFLDNMDGLAAGLAAVASGFFLLLAIVNAQTLVAGLAAAVLGACLGFLFYNFSPAILFMGDAGSLVLGFALAVLGIKLQFTGRPPLSTWMIPIVVLGVPIFDTTLVVISRLRRKLAVAQGGTDHVSHRLVRLGMSPRRAVVALWTIGAALGVTAIWMSRSSEIVSNILMGVLVAGGLIVIVFLEDQRSLPAPARRPGVKPDLRVTVIASGDMLGLAAAAATQISQDVRVLLTPVYPDGSGDSAWTQVTPAAFAEALVALARQPQAVGAFVLNGSAPESNPAPLDLAALAPAATAAFQLQGSLVTTLAAPQRANPAALEALGGTDLILIAGGDLYDNLLPTLAVPEVREILRRSKRPRVLIARQPGPALQALRAAAGERIVTHLVALGQAPWPADGLHGYAVTDLADSASLGEVLAALWLERGRAWMQRGSSAR